MNMNTNIQPMNTIAKVRASNSRNGVQRKLDAYTPRAMRHHEREEIEEQLTDFTAPAIYEPAEAEYAPAEPLRFSPFAAII